MIQSFLTFEIKDRSVTIPWKAVEQYFPVVLFVNPLTPRVKPCVIQHFLTFDSMDRTLTWPFIGMLLSSTLLRCCLFFNFSQLAILDFAPSEVKVLISKSIDVDINLQKSKLDTEPHNWEIFWYTRNNLQYRHAKPLQKTISNNTKLTVWNVFKEGQVSSNQNWGSVVHLKINMPVHTVCEF